ncbi:MAG: hypothetical protein ABI608_10060 [Rhizomicrobium sp.]
MMMLYQIRILRAAGETILLENSYASDFAAVRRARRAAEDDDRVEVWRGMDCIYSEYESRNHAAA